MGKSAKKRPLLPKSNPESEEFDPTRSSLKIVETTSNPSSSLTKAKKKIKTKGVHVNELEDVDTKEIDGASKRSDATIERDTSKKSHNIVPRKPPRGPRYFDPPCFVCGSLEHHVKQCNKGKDCFICKKGGHRAKDCPDKSNWESQNTKICLNCGVSGHEMFSCESMYSPDDLKEIQCYVCKCFGHLCCVKYADEGSREVSCYRCGQLGHSGQECARVHAETGSKWTPSSCRLCGEEAHTVCRCTANSKKEKRKRVSSTPKKKKKKQKNDSVGKCGNDLGAKSTPQRNPRGRGGWITGASSAYGYNHNHGWGSSMTPPMYIPNDGFQFHAGNGYQSFGDRFQFHGGSGYNSSGFYSNPGMFHAPDSNGYQHASRFGNSSNYYGWGS